MKAFIIFKSDETTTVIDENFVFHSVPTFSTKTIVINEVEYEIAETAFTAKKLFVALNEYISNRDRKKRRYAAIKKQAAKEVESLENPFGLGEDAFLAEVDALAAADALDQ
jgi:hypothetical protein